MKNFNLLHIKIIFLSIIMCFALVKVANITTTNPLSLGLFILCFIGLDFYHKEVLEGLFSSLQRNISISLSLAFTTFTTLGGYEKLTADFDNLKFKTFVGILFFVGMFIVFYTFVSIFLIVSATYSITNSNYVHNNKLYPKLPIAAVISCLVCWLPAFLTNFPGIMTIDSMNQYEQAIGALSPSNHHPYIHTLLIKLCLLVGDSFGSKVFGIATYSLCQMLFSAFVIGFLISTFVKLNVTQCYILLVTAFFSLIPYQGYMMVTMWKDIPFSMCLLLFSTCLLRLCLVDDYPVISKKLTNLLYILSGVGVGLLRSNGFYIILLIIPFTLIVFRKYLSKICVLSLFLFLSVIFVKYPLYKTLNVTEPAFVESLSIPLQTMGRVFIEEKASEDERIAWSQYLDVDSIPDYYYANVSDNMKSLVKMGNPEFLDSHKAEFVKLWLITGTKHPVQYINAWGDITRGYWYPDTIPENPIAGDEGIIANDYGLNACPILRGRQFVKIKELLFKMPSLIPIWGLLFSIGVFVWIMLLMVGKIFCGKQKKLLICILPSLLYLFTVFLAIPVGCEFRYGYEFIVCSPLYICAAFINDLEKI